MDKIREVCGKEKKNTLIGLYHHLETEGTKG